MWDMPDWVKHVVWLAPLGLIALVIVGGWALAHVIAALVQYIG